MTSFVNTLYTKFEDNQKLRLEDMTLQIMCASAHCPRQHQGNMADDSVSASFSRYDIRVVIKFSSLLGKSPIEIHADLCKVIGENAPSVQTVRKWVREVESGRSDMKDEDRVGRPKIAICDENVQRVKEVVEEDKRRTCRDISEMIGMPFKIVHRILTEELSKKKVFSKWVPHLLTPEQKRVRVDSARKFLNRIEHEGHGFLSRIVTGDETWVYSFDPELKRQSAQWLDSDEPRPQKARRKQGEKKVMHVVFFDMHGIILNWPVPPGVTVNGEYYRFILKDKLRPAIRKKRPNLLNDGLILHHDNAPVHKSRVVNELIEGYSWELLEHPPYSPDLAPCDFYLFPKMKETLRGHRFDDEEQIQEWTRDALRSLDKSSMVTVFDRWVHRMDKCVELNGDYVE